MNRAKTLETLAGSLSKYRLKFSPESTLITDADANATARRIALQTPEKALERADRALRLALEVEASLDTRHRILLEVCYILSAELERIESALDREETP